MRSGELRHVLDVITATCADDGMGGVAKTESILYQQIRGSIWSGQPKEVMKSGQLVMVVVHPIRIWYHPGITHDMKIGFGARRFNILSIVKPDEIDKYLDLRCEEVF